MTRIIALLFVLLASMAPASAQTMFQADSQVSVRSVLVANNTTAIVVADGVASVYGVEASNNSATVAYVKLYNDPAAVCGSGTPRWRAMIPANGTFSLPILNGDSYAKGITLCVTTGIADSNTGAPAASAYIVNVHFKQQ